MRASILLSFRKRSSPSAATRAAICCAGFPRDDAPSAGPASSGQTTRTAIRLRTGTSALEAVEKRKDIQGVFHYRHYRLRNLGAWVFGAHPVCEACAARTHVNGCHRSCILQVLRQGADDSDRRIRRRVCCSGRSLTLCLLQRRTWQTAPGHSGDLRRQSTRIDKNLSRCVCGRWDGTL